MKIFDGYTYRDATPEEETEFERIAKEEEEERKKMPISYDELASILLGEESE